MVKISSPSPLPPTSDAWNVKLFLCDKINWCSFHTTPLCKFAPLLMSCWLKMKSNEKLRTSQQITVVYPLCLAVSDGGELWRGRCSVSVRGRSLYTLFRSTHAYAGECSGCPLKVSQSVPSSKYMPLTASWPLYISAALCLFFYSIFDSCVVRHISYI